MEFFSKLLERFLDLLFPPRCVFCQKLLESGMHICQNCMNTLPTTGPEAVQRLESIDRCCSPLFYEGNVRSSLLRYKFGGASSYAEVYGEFLSKCIDENDISCDSITWVPLSKKRLRKRGYDQARLLAEALARRQGLPCVPTLQKVHNNRVQSTLRDAKQRKRNVRGVYEALPETTLIGAHILLVDDIVTTGSTLSECARVLQNAGAIQVSAAAVARKRT